MIPVGELLWVKLIEVISTGIRTSAFQMLVIPIHLYSFVLGA